MMGCLPPNPSLAVAFGDFLADLEGERFWNGSEGEQIDRNWARQRGYWVKKKR